MSKTIIVTGAVSAYGRAIIQTLADEGHGVVAIVDPINESNIAAATELQQTDNVELVEVDVKDDKSVHSGFSLILQRYGHVDVLINNEGTARTALSLSTPIDYYQEVFNINVCGVLRAFMAVLPTMRKNKGGLLINVNSGVSYFATPLVTALTMAKAGLENLTEGILREVRRFGIESVSLWTGHYPPDLVSDSDWLQNEGADDLLEDEKLKLEASISEKNRQSKQQAQTVAATVLELINLPNGSRPQRYSMNSNLDEAEIQYTAANKLAAEFWDETYGIKI